jgi:hypothetical protein
VHGINVACEHPVVLYCIHVFVAVFRATYNTSHK